MYIFVSVLEKESYYRRGPSGAVKARLEQASGERCLVVPYQELDMRVVEELGPRAVVMGGFGGHVQARKVKWFLGIDEVLHEADLPILGLCGSHQLIGFSFNRNMRKAKVLKDQPMRRLRPGEDLPRMMPQGDPRHGMSDSFIAKGFFAATGFFPIKRVRKDPLFRRLPQTMIMRCAHYCEVKKLPPGFVLLARSGHCRIAAMRHRKRPLYGTQFHPESYAAPFFHGRALLENFAKIVEDFWRER